MRRVIVSELIRSGVRIRFYLCGKVSFEWNDEGYKGLKVNKEVCFGIMY